MKVGKKLFKRFAAFLLLTVAIVSALSLTACGKPAKKSVQFDILSFNIRVENSSDTGTKNWSKRKSHVIDYIKESDANVVCLQELAKTQSTDIIAGLEGSYNVVYYERENSSNPEGLAVCYDDSFELVKQDRFWLSETPDEVSKGWGASYYRICVNLLLKHVETGVYLNVFDLHLDNVSEEARVNGMKLVIDRAEAAGYPYLIAGDCNDVKDSSFHEVVVEKALDCQAEALSSTTEGVTYHDWGKPIEKLTNKSAIDFCFVSKTVKPIIFEIKQETVSENFYYSDHYAILSVISVEYLEQKTK